MKKALKYIFFITLFFIGIFNCSAGNKPTGADPPSPQGTPGPIGEPLPIDNYLYILLIIGILFIYFYVKQNKKRQFKN